MLLRSTLVFALITTFSAVASAQEPASVQKLMEEIDEEVAQLDTSDCSAACVALESMKRAAERVCELDPGEACQKARDKVEEARKKVSAACPDCAAAKAKTAVVEEGKPEPESEPKLDMEPEAPSGGPGRDVSPSAPPPSEDEAGGCAACTVGRGGSTDAAWWIAAGLALAAIRRRRQSD